ncbi:hypothetical protein J6590_098502 [Homalodisca vitripennis]|nr:hypothetical protein J6590_098502 [Homalodisca vitripennis]
MLGRHPIGNAPGNYPPAQAPDHYMSPPLLTKDEVTLATQLPEYYHTKSYRHGKANTTEFNLFHNELIIDLSTPDPNLGAVETIYVLYNAATQSTQDRWFLPLPSVGIADDRRDSVIPHCSMVS